MFETTEKQIKNLLQFLLSQFHRHNDKSELNLMVGDIVERIIQRKV